MNLDELDLRNTDFELRYNSYLPAGERWRCAMFWHEQRLNRRLFSCVAATAEHAVTRVREQLIEALRVAEEVVE